MYMSSSEDEEFSNGWDSDWSTDLEELVKRIEEVVSSPKLIKGRGMTTENMDDDTPAAGPSTSKPNRDSTPKLNRENFDESLCYAPAEENPKRKLQLNS